LESDTDYHYSLDALGSVYSLTDGNEAVQNDYLYEAFGSTRGTLIGDRCLACFGIRVPSKVKPVLHFRPMDATLRVEPEGVLACPSQMSFPCAGLVGGGK